MVYAGTICLSLQIRNWLLEQLPALGEVALYRLSSSTPVLPCHSSWQGTETPRGNFRSRLSFGVIYDSAVLLILSPASRTCDPMRLPFFNLHSALQGSEGVTIMLAECLPQCGAGPRVLHKQVLAALTCVLEPKQQSAVRCTRPNWVPAFGTWSRALGVSIPVGTLASRSRTRTGSG